jgi:hypothetical protein
MTAINLALRNHYGHVVHGDSLRVQLSPAAWDWRLVSVPIAKVFNRGGLDSISRTTLVAEANLKSTLLAATQ